MSTRRRNRIIALRRVCAVAAVGYSALFIAGCGGGSDSGDRADSLAQHSMTTEEHGNDAHTHSMSGDMANAHTNTTQLEFTSEPSSIPAGAPATWTLKILDASSGEPVQQFDTVHEKLMHLIVVSADLAWFNHLHPEYKGNGMFTVRATLPHVGGYKLYADYTPKGGTQEVPQYEFATGGAQPSPTSILPVVDTFGPDGWMLYKASARPEGQPEATGGASYQVALMPMPAQLVVGQDAMLHFQVRDAGGRPVTDLQPYLGAMGHAVILSSDTKVYLHAHPMSGGMEGMNHGDANHGTSATEKTGTATGPDVIFHTNFPAPGFYKVWGQFQHRGKIITAPFVLKVS